MCDSLSETCCCCAVDDSDGGVSGGGGCAGPFPSTGGVWCSATVSVVPSNMASDEASEGPLAGGKAPSGDEVDAAAIHCPKYCGTNDEGDGTGVNDGGGLFL